MDETFFARVPIQEIEVSGVRIKFPVRYYDGMTMGANFPTPVDKVQAVLPSHKLKPVQIAPGITTVYLGAMEYHHVEGLAPYNEFGIMVPCLYEAGDDTPELPGSFVYHLPVTTEEARWGGVEIYGYPKFIAEINFEDVGEMRRCRVRTEGKDIITLQVNKLAAEPQSSESYTYTVKDGQLVRTYIQSQGLLGASEVGGGASYALGLHAVADQVRALGMDETSLGHQYAPQVQMMLHAPGARLAL